MTNVSQWVVKLPVLPGYLTVTEAARVLRISRASVYLRVEKGDFETAVRVGKDINDRVTILLGADEVKNFINVLQHSSQARAAQRDYSVALRAWNKRVKDWARDRPELGEIAQHNAGQPSMELRRAYEAAKPDDLRPIKPAE